MAEGGLASHQRWLRRQLRQRRDCLLRELQQWPIPLNVSQPNGGLTLWVALPEQSDTLAGYDLALQEDIVLTPGPLFSNSGHYRNCLRISFAQHWDDVRLAALRRVPELLGLV
jgi:DNA-binding transcriptional MocR family regulator